MHTDITKLLSEIGLTDTEQKIYVAGLSHGAGSAATLAIQTGIRRTTVYSALASLEQAGFASVRSDEQKSVYTMSDPVMIEAKLEEKIAVLEAQKNEAAEVLPLFDKLMQGAGASTSVTYFTGERGVRTAIDQALFCRSKKWQILAPTDNYFSNSDAVYAAYFIKTRKQRDIQANSLWEPSFVSKRKFSQSTIDMRNPRVIPKALEGKFESTIILFDQKVLFVNSAAELSAVVIESPEIAATMQVFFTGLWASAKPIGKRYVK